MTKSLAYELGTDGIRVNTIAPGTIHTPLVEKSLSSMKEEAKNKFLDSIPTLYPLGRLGETEDIGGINLISRFKSSKMDYRGAIINADGGLTTK